MNYMKLQTVVIWSGHKKDNLFHAVVSLYIGLITELHNHNITITNRNESASFFSVSWSFINSLIQRCNFVIYRYFNPMFMTLLTNANYTAL